jgi:hypothetical protein
VAAGNGGDGSCRGDHGGFGVILSTFRSLLLTLAVVFFLSPVLRSLSRQRGADQKSIFNL